MTGSQLLIELQKLSKEQLEREVWFANEFTTSRLGRVNIETENTYYDHEWDEVFFHSDYPDKELKELIEEGTITCLTKKGDIILSDDK